VGRAGVEECDCHDVPYIDEYLHCLDAPHAHAGDGVEGDAQRVVSGCEHGALDLLINCLLVVGLSKLEEEKLLTTTTNDEFLTAVVAQSIGAPLSHLCPRQAAAR
jgi:hypothetical protein